MSRRAAAGEPDAPLQQSKVEERAESPNVSRAQDHYQSDTRERIIRCIGTAKLVQMGLTAHGTESAGG